MAGVLDGPADRWVLGNAIAYSAESSHCFADVPAGRVAGIPRSYPENERRARESAPAARRAGPESPTTSIGGTDSDPVGALRGGIIPPHPYTDHVVHP